MPHQKQRYVGRLQPSRLLANLPAAPLPQPTAFGSPLSGEALRGIPLGSQHVPACSSLSQRAAGYASDILTPSAAQTSQQHHQQAMGVREDDHPEQPCPPGSTHHQHADQSDDATDPPSPSMKALNSLALVCHGMDMDSAALRQHVNEDARDMEQHISSCLDELVSESHQHTALLQGMRVAQAIHANELTALIRQALSGQASDPSKPLHQPAATFREESAALGLAGHWQLGACLQHSMDMVLRSQRSDGTSRDDDPNHGQPNELSGLSSPPASADQSLEGLPLPPGLDGRLPSQRECHRAMCRAPSTSRVCLHLHIST